MVELFRISEKQNEAFDGLKPSSLDPEATVGPPKQKPLSFRLALRREPMRTPSKEQVSPLDSQSSGGADGSPLSAAGKRNAR